MVAEDRIQDLLADLSTLTDIARAGVISKREQRLEPGEIRPVAVLFLDMVGFTPLTKKIGAEQISKLIDRTFRIFELTVKAQGGYQTGFAGDGAHYIFAGHPNYPPVCEAVLRAALKLRERVLQVNESLSETGLSINFRIGVNFGEVMVHATAGVGGQPTIFGDAINLAARLESSAEPGMIQTVDAVLEKAGDVFISRELGTKVLKGIGNIATYEVTAIQEPPVQLRGAFRKLTPLVGRDDLLEQAAAQIEEWWQTTYSTDTLDIAQSSQPIKTRNRLLVFSGVAAVGKSRIAYELVERLKRSHQIVSATGHCTENASFAGFTAELARAAGLNSENLIERWEKLCASAARAVGEEYAQRQRRHLPLLAYVLENAQVDTSGIRQADTASFESACRLALRACCELAAHDAAKPLVLIIEDLQWLGSLKATLTDVVANTCLAQPLVIVATARPEFKLEASELTKEEGRTYRLSTLLRQEGVLILEQLLPGVLLPAELADELHEKAAGLPYYYEEFARMLVQRGLVRRSGSKYSLVTDSIHLDIPTNLQALVLGRLDQLIADEKRIIVAASLLGMRFERSVLLSLAEQVYLLSPDAIDRTLSLLQQRGFLLEDEEHSMSFKHILVRDTAYSSLLMQNKRLLHERVAAIYAERLVPGGENELYLLKLQIQHLLQADKQREAYLLCGDLLVLLAITGRTENWDYWMETADACLKAAEAQGNAPEFPGSKTERALGIRLLRQGNHKEARERFQLALEIAEQAGDERDTMQAYCNLGICARESGDLPSARAFYEIAIALAKRLNSQKTLAVLLGNLGLVHYKLGNSEPALNHYRQAQDISRSIGSLSTESMALIFEGTLHLGSCDNEHALDAYTKVLQLSKQTGDHIHESMALTNIGVTLESMGRIDEADVYLETALKLDRQIGWRDGEPFSLFNLAEIAQNRGDYQKALRLYQEAMSLFQFQPDTDFHLVSLSYVAKAYAFTGAFEESKQTLLSVDRLCNSNNSVAKGLAHCCWAYLHIFQEDIDSAHSCLYKARCIHDSSNSALQGQLKTELDRLVSFMHARAM